MSQHNPALELFARGSQRVAHVAEEQKLGRRHAIRMRGDMTLANVNFPARTQFAQVIVRPAVTEPELEHRAIEIAHQGRPRAEAGALGLEPADEAVEPAHRGSGGDVGALAQLFYFGEGGAELLV